jgi:ankyrin repeat protein
VELLLKAGAKINGSLYKEGVGHDCWFYSPIMVAEFTPLVYALRYASDDVINLLVASGAKLGNADKERISKWVLANKNISKEILNQRLIKFDCPIKNETDI